MKVVALRPQNSCDDIVTGLRNIANDIEAGKFGLMTTCVVCLGHTEDRPADGGTVQSDMNEVFGLGPRSDTFTIRGLLLTCATQRWD